MQNIPIALVTNGPRSTCCSCMQHGGLQSGCSLEHADCFVQCTSHPSPPRCRSLGWGSLNSRHPPLSSLLSPPLCRGQVWSLVTAWQISTLNFGNIKMLCSVLALSPSTESSLKWWPPPHHLSPPCINWIQSNLETFLPDLNQLAAGERGWVEGGEYLGGRRMFHSITSPILVAGLMNIYGYCCSPGLDQQVPRPRDGESASIDPVMVVTWSPSFGHAGVTLKCPPTQYCHLHWRSFSFWSLACVFYELMLV